MCIRDSCGIGQALIERIFTEAIASGARMIVLETQSYNSKAILFYMKNGFEIIGFDRYEMCIRDRIRSLCILTEMLKDRISF